MQNWSKINMKIENRNLEIVEEKIQLHQQKSTSTANSVHLHIVLSAAFIFHSNRFLFGEGGDTLFSINKHISY